MTFCRSIEDFKAVLQGGGVRPTMFQVELAFPNIVVPDPQIAANDGIFLVKAAQIPDSTIGVIEVPFRGRRLKVSGDRSFAPWSITVINDVSQTIRKAFEEWSELIQNHNFTCGANEIRDYLADSVVRQFDRDGNQLRAYMMNGCWPSEIQPIDLAFDAYDTIEEYQVTMSYQYWSAADEGDPRVGSISRKSYEDLNAIST